MDGFTSALFSDKYRPAVFLVEQSFVASIRPERKVERLTAATRVCMAVSMRAVLMSAAHLSS